jgi:hypothetical protein
MQFMLLIYAPVDATPDPDVHAAYMTFTEELQASGAMVAGDGLEGLEAATTVRVRDDETLLTDGPFAETKEMLAGYYVVDVPDLDEALKWAAKIPGAAFGSIEVRPVRVFERV